MKKIPKNPFILVDGSSYLFRAYHALPPLTTSKGQPTGAIFGVINMLKRLLKDYAPEKMVVIFDSKEKNFRHQLYEPYKANRVVMPDELQQQIEPLHQLIRAMGLPLLVIPGVEADDIIGTLAKKAKKEGIFSLISTGDKDFAQIVDEDIYLINTMSQDIFDRERVIEKFEVAPERMIDYLALIGDSVDNIPGVHKVGPKTAIKWLQTYGTLDEIIRHAEEIPGKVGENLREVLDKLPLFRELITIDVKIPLEKEVKDFVLGAPEREKLKELYRELEFKSWLRDLEGEESGSWRNTGGGDTVQKGTGGTSGIHADSLMKKIAEIPKDAHYEVIFEKDKLKELVKKLREAKFFAFDTETTSLDYMQAEIVGVSFSLSVGTGVYIPFGHDYENAPTQISAAEVWKELVPILEDETLFKVGHNLKYDAEVLLNHGITLRGMKFDSMLESYVLDSAGSRHDMDTLAEKYLSYIPISYEEVAGKGAKQIPFNKVSIEKAALYAAEDADVTLRLHQCLWNELEKIPSLKSVFTNIEMPLMSVLVRMERLGVLIDDKLLKKQSTEIEQRLKELEEDAYQVAGAPFNMNSPKQLQEILFTQLNLPVIEKTPTGQPSTAESVLQELAEKYPLPKIILEYRSLSKLKSTYTDRLPEQIDPKTHRIHTSYHQAITSTGRLSSSDPNLQNIPIRTAEGRKIRAAFIASPGYKIVTADYSQIELRIMAHMSQDKALLNAFNKDDDIHRSTASEVFKVPLDKVSYEQRRSAKVINFGLIYGMSGFGLAKQLGVERHEAQKYIDQYFAAFPGVKGFISNILAEAKEKGFVETLFGRRLYLKELNSRNVMMRRAAERAATNAPMQGSNADIIKLAMLELDQYCQESKDKVRMIMQVHDELVFEVSEDILEDASEKIKSVMENVVSLSVKLNVGIGIGANWDEAHRT